MRDYELTVVAKEGFDLEAFLKKLKLKVLKSNKPVERSLAYSIKKESKAVYSYVELELDPAVVSDLEAKIRLEDKILRHLLVWREDR